jgi:hypothetical protein
MSFKGVVGHIEHKPIIPQFLFYHKNSLFASVSWILAKFVELFGSLSNYVYLCVFSSANIKFNPMNKPKPTINNNPQPRGFLLPDGCEWFSIHQMMSMLDRTRECIRLRVKNGTIESTEWGGVDFYRLSNGTVIVRG